MRCLNVTVCNLSEGIELARSFMFPASGGSGLLMVPRAVAINRNLFRPTGNIVASLLQLLTELVPALATFSSLQQGVFGTGGCLERF